jgi:hypothetical protein
MPGALPSTWRRARRLLRAECAAGQSRRPARDVDPLADPRARRFVRPRASRRAPRRRSSACAPEEPRSDRLRKGAARCKLADGSLCARGNRADRGGRGRSPLRGARRRERPRSRERRRWAHPPELLDRTDRTGVRAAKQLWAARRDRDRRRHSGARRRGRTRALRRSSRRLRGTRVEERVVHFEGLGSSVSPLHLARSFHPIAPAIDASRAPTSDRFLHWAVDPHHDRASRSLRVRHERMKGPRRARECDERIVVGKHPSHGRADVVVKTPIESGPPAVALLPCAIREIEDDRRRPHRLVGVDAFDRWIPCRVIANRWVRDDDPLMLTVRKPCGAQIVVRSAVLASRKVVVERGGDLAVSTNAEDPLHEVVP